MSKKVLYVILKQGQTAVSDETMSSVKEALHKEDTVVSINLNDDTEKYSQYKTQINSIVNDVNNFDYVFLLSNGSVVNSSIGDIFREQLLDDVTPAEGEEKVNVTYMPMAIYNYKNKDISGTLVLNKHIWNSSMAYEAGVLDIDLATKQVDSTVFGCFIPVELFFDENLYLDDIKYYQQYYMLNSLSDGNNLVYGIPKLSIIKTEWDFLHSDATNEDKVENFNKARVKWLSKSEEKK